MFVRSGSRPCTSPVRFTPGPAADYARLALSRKTGHDPSLLGLLRVYKNYYPEVIVGESTRGKASAFKHPDPQWRERLGQIREAHAHQQASTAAEAPRLGFRVTREASRHMPSQKTAQIPTVHTTHAHEVCAVTHNVAEILSGLTCCIGLRDP